MSVALRIVLIIIVVVTLLIATQLYILRNSASEILSPNSPPVAVDDSYTVHASLLLSPMANDFDPDAGDSISFQGIASQPQHGTLTPYNPGKYTYRPAYGYVGSDTFTYTICDSHSACSTGTVNITNVNQPPVANTDNYTVHTTILISPRANDTDPDGDNVSFNSISQPQHGSLTPYNTGRYTYRPTYGYVGLDSFTYTVKDSLGAISTGTINMTVVNQAPIANPDFYALHEPQLISPRGNDTDPDGDNVSFQSIATQPQHGWLQPYNSSSYTYFPYSGYAGSDSFTYTINDSLGAVATGTVYLLVFSEAPVAAPPPHSCGVPLDPGIQGCFNAAVGGATGSSGPSKGDPVNLATGRESYVPDPDLTVYNPTGPAVSWQRSYIGNQALAEPTGYGSPGFSRGWVQNYDLRIQGTSGSWGALKLFYPNGANETLTPQLSGGVPTGSFSAVAGAPYNVTGISGSPTGTWQSVTVTWRDQAKWKFTLLSGTTYALTQITNRTGQSLNLTWNSSRALTQITDAGTSAVLLTLAYDTNGRLLTVTDIYGRQVAYTFSVGTSTSPIMLQTVSQVVSSGTSNPPARWAYTYTTDNGQQLNTITVPSPIGSGNSTATINYDSIGRVASLVDANGNQRIYNYNTDTTQVQVKDAANNLALSWTQKFSSSGLDTGITDTANHSTTIAYSDPANPLKPTSVTDRNNHTTSYTYDQFGNVLTATTPRNVTTYTWSYSSFALGRLMSVQEGTKPATTITYYEPSGLVQTITRPAPNGSGTTTTTFTYDSLGNVLTVVGPGNNATTQITTTLNYTTDGGYSQTAKVGQPITITDNLSHVRHLRYDAQGRVTSVTDAIGNETNLSYNLVGQTDAVTFPATGQTGIGRARRVNGYLYVGGPLITITSFNESNLQVRQVTNTYGLEGELLSVGGSTEPVTHTYDALYRLKTLKDGNNNTTTYAYNNIGLVSLITMPGGQTTQFPSYDNDGNLLQRIDGNGVVTNYLYTDPESLLTDIEYPASTSLNIQFGYDSFGRRTSMTDGTGSHSYTYGNLDELLSQTTTYTGLPAKTISYAYYPDGSRQTMTTPAGTFSYNYDAAGRPSSMTNPFSETASWSYLNNDWLETETLANGAIATYIHNPLGQLTRLLNQIGGNTISDFSNIGYDGVGNRTSITASIPGATALSGVTMYQYNSKNELTQESSTRNGGFTDNFDYDSAGNPTSFKGVTKTYNSNNQQTGTGLTYDNNGNPTTFNGVSLSFDPEDKLTSHAALTAGYRGDKLRAWKQSSSGRTYFIYDGTDPVLELDSAGAVVATNSFSPRGIVSRRVSSVTVLYAFDHEGNVSQRTDASANTLSHHLFTAHGLSLTGALDEPFGYRAKSGYYTDIESSFQLLTNRYYDPSSGRFLTRDPIGYAGGINLYSYVRNNPANYADPSGLTPGVLALPALPALGPALVPLGIAAAYAGILYGSWTFGEWLADQPWNPLTHPAAPPLCPPLPVSRPTPITMAPPAPPPADEDCKEEWEEAYRICAESIGRGDRRGITGGYTNLNDCARGLVSERCGGNRVEN